MLLVNTKRALDEAALEDPWLNSPLRSMSLSSYIPSSLDNRIPYLSLIH